MHSLICTALVLIGAHLALGQVKPLYPTYPDYPLLPKQVINEKSLLRKCFGSSKDCSSVAKCEKKCASWVPGNRFGDIKSFGCQGSPQKCCCEYEQAKEPAAKAQYDTCVAQPVCQPAECESQCGEFGAVEKFECTSEDTCCCKNGPKNDGSKEECFEASDQCAPGACEAKCEFHKEEYKYGPLEKFACKPQKGNEKFKCCCSYGKPEPTTAAPPPDGGDAGPDGEEPSYYYS